MILALNPFQARIGWFMASAVGPVRFGTSKLADTSDVGAYLASVDAFLGVILPQAESLACRRPFVSGEAAFAAALKNVGMLGHILYQAGFFPHLGPPSLIEMGTARHTLTGYGHAKDEQMIAAARREGVEVRDHHEAGAYAIWKTCVFGAAPVRPSARSGKGRSIMKEN